MTFLSLGGRLLKRRGRDYLRSEHNLLSRSSIREQDDSVLARDSPPRLLLVELLGHTLGQTDDD